jgi:hypothetical protein
MRDWSKWSGRGVAQRAAATESRTVNGFLDTRWFGKRGVKKFYRDQAPRERIYLKYFSRFSSFSKSEVVH